jgi:diphosphate-dependent phosphofructokinase
MEKETTMDGTFQAEIPASRQIEDLLATETGFQKERRAYQPGQCPALAGVGITRPLDGGGLEVIKVARELLPFVSQNRLLEIIPGGNPRSEPLRLGIVLSGGPAPGGHNAIAGVFEAAKAGHPDSLVVGFLAGPKGIIGNRHLEVTGEMVALYKNSGGFHMLGTGREKIDTPEKM